MCEVLCFVKSSFNWVSAVSPTLGCSIEIRMIYMYMYVGMSICLRFYGKPTQKNRMSKCVGGIT